ncbi:MAG TPA: radical SAM family heme chaperone HemW [Acidimicrobiia bacterium]|nr:radical SAM family heme chaperone HemW [Acidimicrobiia bacterium]
MSSTDVDEHASKAAAYVHIPFCSAVCPYCDFAVVAGADDQIDRYIDAVIAEIELSDTWRMLDAVYFGGGTPSHVRPPLLGRILGVLRARHGVANDAEISLEANPEDFSEERAHELFTAGFNRVSFGAQSFDDVVLARLGRRHRATDIERSVENARRAGFTNVSVDLIFGTPEESEESWELSLKRAIDLRPDHVSGYALTVEPGTPLHREVKAGADAPDPDTQADRYEKAERLLPMAGLERYEVSNWSRSGQECRYNLVVWAQGEYEAYGNGAHRFLDGVRSHNVRRLDAYMDRVETGLRPIAGADPIEGWDVEIDRLFVGLRRSAGVSPGPGVESLIQTSGGQMLLREGIIEVAGGRLMVRRPLLTDEVHRQVLDLDPPQGWVESINTDNL